jgi:hypothetical protein
MILDVEVEQIHYLLETTKNRIQSRIDCQLNGDTRGRRDPNGSVTTAFDVRVYPDNEDADLLRVLSAESRGIARELGQAGGSVLMVVPRTLMLDATRVVNDAEAVTAGHRDVRKEDVFPVDKRWIRAIISWQKRAQLDGVRKDSDSGQWEPRLKAFQLPRQIRDPVAQNLNLERLVVGLNRRRSTRSTRRRSASRTPSNIQMETLGRWRCILLRCLAFVQDLMLLLEVVTRRNVTAELAVGVGPVLFGTCMISAFLLRGTLAE